MAFRGRGRGRGFYRGGGGPYVKEEVVEEIQPATPYPTLTKYPIQLSDNSKYDAMSLHRQSLINEIRKTYVIEHIYDDVQAKMKAASSVFNWNSFPKELLPSNKRKHIKDNTVVPGKKSKTNNITPNFDKLFEGYEKKEVEGDELNNIDANDLDIGLRDPDEIFRASDDDDDDADGADKDNQDGEDVAHGSDSDDGDYLGNYFDSGEGEDYDDDEDGEKDYS